MEKLSLYCYIVKFALPFFFSWQVIGFVDAMLRYKKLGNRLFILTQILITMDYFFYLFISDLNLQFREKSILIWAISFIIKSITKGIEILAKSLA